MHSRQLIRPEHVLSKLGQKTVLLVDDDPLVLDINEVFLGDCGWTVHRAHSVDEAAVILLKHPVDLVLTDFHMPGKTGDEIYEVVSTFNEPPVFVFLTTDPTHNTVSGFKKSKKAHVWQKPVTPSQMYSNLLEVFR